MSLHRKLLLALAPPLCWIALPFACASPGAASVPNAREPTPPPLASGSVSVADAGSVVPFATTPTAGSPDAAPPEDLASAPAPSAEPAPPCIGGEVLMGSCICDKGKTPDETGHCVYPPCPRLTTGGTAFRDQTTGQCLECPEGTRPTKEGKCEH